MENSARADLKGGKRLSLVAAKEHKVVVKLLLTWVEVDMNTPGTHGATLLFLAAEKGHKDVIELPVG